jgi:hypothetical protein
MAMFAMTPEAEAAAPPEETETPRRLPDLLGLAYLAILGVVMTAWVGALAWIALAAIRWLAS